METIAIGLLLPLLGTMLGSAFVFFMKDQMPVRVQKSLLAFAAGAMFYVVVEELIPEASDGEHSNLSTIGFAIGFVLMMVLDVVMG
jgi:zinc transporter ZupT